jgi:hypothetical protein
MEDGLESSVEVFDVALERNRAGLDRAIGTDLDALQSILNQLHQLAAHHYPWLGALATVNPSTRVIFPCFHFALVNCQTALYLTRRGLYAPARPIMRQAYEAGVIAKFCSVAHDSSVFDYWAENQEVSLGNDVFANLSHPNPTALRRFWRTTSQLTHSMAMSGQWVLRIKDARGLQEVLTNAAFIGMLTECMYHLHSTHLATRSVRYYQASFGDQEEVRALATALKRDMSNFRRAHMGEEAKRLVRDYKAKWTVRGSGSAG